MWAFDLAAANDQSASKAVMVFQFQQSLLPPMGGPVIHGLDAGYPETAILTVPQSIHDLRVKASAHAGLSYATDGLDGVGDPEH